MSLSILSPSRTILMISDEALLVYSVDSKGVRFVEDVPWDSDDFEDSVSLIISKECGGKPVLILNDMVEQHYRKEKVPRVSALDKQSIVKRKLKVAFPNYPVRAALPLKEKISKTDKSLGGSVYIFAAVPASDAFTKTMNAARLSLAPIAGFCLLPVESSDMIKKLSDKLSTKGESKAQWTIFMGQHQNGGLRQIVTRNGELALTRMTPISETDDNPVTWAKDVHQEFQATMSYLSRFGFDPSDGLNVILISEPDTGDIVSELIDAPCNFYSLTSDDASDTLKLDLGPKNKASHATSMHLAWIGRKTRFILPMKAKQIDRVSQPRQMASLASFFFILLAAFFGYQLLNNMQAVSEAKIDVEDISYRKGQLDLQYSKEVKHKEDLGYNIQLIQSSLAVYDNLESKQINILPLFRNIGSALGRDMRIDTLDFKRGKQGFVKKIINGTAKGPLFDANMQMTFPSTTNAEKGNAEVKSLKGRLQKILPDHVVDITKLLEDYEYSEEIVVETGDAKTSATSQDYVAEINIEGPVQ